MSKTALTRLPHVGPTSSKQIQSRQLLVTERPRLAALTNFPRVSILDYERGLKPLQHKLQLVQQAYLATGERAVVVLEDGIRPAKAA
jgi:hypothetical protein